MPEKQTIDRAQKAKREGKSPSTQAGEFVREEIHHIRERKHGARASGSLPPRKGKVFRIDAAQRRARLSGRP